MPSKTLPYRLRADLYAQLTAMEKAGLSAAKAFAVLHLPKAYGSALAMVRKAIEQGESPAIAGQKYGLCGRFEARLLTAAFAAGSPAATYAKLAEHYASKADRSRAVKARLTLPIATLVMALLLNPLPALVSGAIGVGGYLASSLLPLAVLAILAKLFISMNARLEAGVDHAEAGLIEFLILRLPVFGRLCIRRCNRDFFESLALLLDAGIPMFDALPLALETIHFGSVRHAFKRITQKVRSGATLADALEGICYLASEQVIAFVNTGESSGRLPEMLFRYTSAEAATISQTEQQLADWLPRLVYVAIAGWIAYGLISSHAFMPNLPSELQ